MVKSQPDAGFTFFMKWGLGIVSALIVVGITTLIGITLGGKSTNDSNWARNSEQIADIRTTLSDIKASLPTYAKASDLAIVSKRVDDCITKEDGDQRGKIRDMKEEVLTTRLSTDEAAIQAIQASEGRRK